MKQASPQRRGDAEEKNILVLSLRLGASAVKLRSF